MASSTSKILRMTFRNQAGSNVVISLDNPKSDITSTEILAAMDLVIARNIFNSSGGDLISKYDIKIINSVTDDLYDPLA